MTLDFALVSFKSIPVFFVKEKDGRKPNTVRRVTGDDDRWSVLCDWAVSGEYGLIEIINSHTGERFKRKVTDVSEFMGFFIISWKHENNSEVVGGKE